MQPPDPARVPNRRPLLWVGGLGAALTSALLVLWGRGSAAGDAPARPDLGPEPPVEVAPGPALPARPPNAVRIDTEQLLAEELIELRSRDPAAYQARLLELLGGTGTERLVAIAHIREQGLRDPVPLLADVVRDGGSDARVRSEAAELLGPWAAHDPRARAALIDFLETGPENPSERSNAFRAVLGPGDRREFDRCLPLVLAETDANVVIAAARAIAASHVPEVRIRAESLHWRHPDPDVRRRLRGTRLSR